MGWDRNIFQEKQKTALGNRPYFYGRSEKKRKGFRIGHTEVFLKGVGKVRAVCSGFKKKRDGHRIYIACGCLKSLPRQILTAYRHRWKTGFFHKHIKMHSGFEDMAARHFSSVVSHVHPVYTAYILLHSGLPGIGEGNGTVIEKQGKVRRILKNRETANIIHELTKIGGSERYKNELKKALAA